MTEESDKGSEGSRVPGIISSQFSNAPVMPAPAQKKDTKENQGGNGTETLQNVRRELHWLEVLNFCGQIILAAVGIVGVCIYGRQLRVMQGQLDEMKRSGEQSTEQMWSAIGNINWMARSMDWSQKSTKQSMGEEVAKLQLQVDQVKRSSDAQIKQLAAFEDAQSAQLVAGEFNPAITALPGDSVEFTGVIEITNDGPTVAREIFKHGGDAFWAAIELPTSPRPKMTPTPTPNGSSLAPGKSFEIRVGEGTGMWSDIAAGRRFMGVDIAVSYSDIFHRPQLERECYTYSAQNKRFLRGCPREVKNFVFQFP